MLLYIIRHGDPDYKTDSLTERGKLQAEALGQRLFRSRIDRVFSSPMGRAKLTAEPTCRLLGLECNIEEWAHEIGHELITKCPDGKDKAVTVVQNTYFRENNMWDLPYSRGMECSVFDDTGMASAGST